jgi:murein DD-endopeptidase MepM/ murein hydrolase activator NlpD
VRLGPALAALLTCFALGFAAAAVAGAAPGPDAAPDAAPGAAPEPQAPMPGPQGPTPGPQGPVGAVKPKPDAATGTTETGPENNSKPLSITPPLGAFRYVFPIVGDVLWGDSYGVLRLDVPGKWHHGDDLFAPLGTPVVAVADGTLSDVGWERLGGWRLWLTNSAGDSFYYAHLSGFTPLALHATHVRAGQVLAFVGNTGDADGGAYHVHFEVHPVATRSLGEDGAVNPTGYLAQWRHLQSVAFSKPVLPALPGGPAAGQAQAEYSQLLAVPALQQQLAQRAAAGRNRRAAALRARQVAEAAAAYALQTHPRVLRPAAPKRAVAYSPPVALKVQRTASPAPRAAATAQRSSGGSSLQIAGGLAAALVFAAGGLLLHRSGRVSLRRVLRRADVS